MLQPPELGYFFSSNQRQGKQWAELNTLFIYINYSAWPGDAVHLTLRNVQQRTQ